MKKKIGRRRRRKRKGGWKKKKKEERKRGKEVRLDPDLAKKKCTMKLGLVALFVTEF